MAYGFFTTKNDSGFKWGITRTTWNEIEQKGETVTVMHGFAATRAKALGQAKKWVRTYRLQK